MANNINRLPNQKATKLKSKFSANPELAYLGFKQPAQKIHNTNKNIGKTVLSVPVQLFQHFPNSYPKFIQLLAFPLGIFFSDICLISDFT